MKIFHKFGAVRCEADGIKFGSKLERNYYLKLMEAKKDGSLIMFLRQVPFHLDGNIRYVIDFVEFWKTEEEGAAEIKFTDVKGLATDIYKLKKKLVESEYPIKINEVFKV